MNPFTGDSARNLACEISTDNVTFRDLSGEAGSIQPSGGDRATGDFFEFKDDAPNVVVGKKAARETIVRIAYKDGDSDEAQLIEGYHRNATRVYFRWSPLGGGSGAHWFSTSPYAYVIGYNYPGGEAASGDPVLLEFRLRFSEIIPSEKTS